MGLRMIESVVQHKGEKRFKKKQPPPPTAATERASPRESYHSASSPTNWDQAASDFRKSFYSSSYSRHFGGDTGKKLRETEVYLLGKQRFSESNICEVLGSAVI